MSENRYSVKTVSNYLSISTSGIYYRMKKCKIASEHGLSARDVKQIMQYPATRKRLHTTLEDLKKEMEALSHE